MDENKILTDEQLQAVSGGDPSNRSDKFGNVKCQFTPDRSERRNGALKCASSCVGCKCHGTKWCVDRWHQVDGNDELYPLDYVNHSDKPKIRNYNT